MKSSAKIIEEIRQQINRYHQRGNSATIDDLLDIQDNISIRSFTLASYVADYKASYNASYFRRRLGIAKSSLKHQQSGMKIATADHQAIIDMADEYETEQAHEATAIQMDLLLRQTNVIINSISQRISYLKMEYANTTQK